MNRQQCHPPGEAADILTHCKRLAIASTTDELVDLACGGPKSDSSEVACDVPGKGRVVEATVGGGKTEMLQQPHREPDGRVLMGENRVTGEWRCLEIPRSCELHAVTDDMALCHPSLQEGKGKLTLTDAENAWFVRVNHLEHYGTDVHLEKLATEPPVPLLFLTIDAVPGSRALVWEHIEFRLPNQACSGSWTATFPRWKNARCQAGE